MPLKDYQKTLQLATLYAVAEGAKQGNEQLQQNLEIIGGTVDIYGSQVFPVSPPTGMFKTQTAFNGIANFAVIPNYLYIAQNSGSTTSIVVSGLEVIANPTS